MKRLRIKISFSALQIAFAVIIVIGGNFIIAGSADNVAFRKMRTRSRHLFSQIFFFGHTGAFG